MPMSVSASTASPVPVRVPLRVVHRPRRDLEPRHSRQQRVRVVVAGLPAITYLPIPGHGRANADLLARAGIAPWPRTVDELADAVDAVCEPPQVTRRSPWPAGADPATSVLELLPDRAGLLGAVSGF